MKKQAVVTLETRGQKLQEKVNIEIKNNKINYKEQNKTDVLFDMDQKILMRENKEMYMEFFFQTQKGYIHPKDLKNTIEIEIKSKKIDIQPNKIVIKYEIENDPYVYQIEMED